jgi:hypothetical protein
VWAETVIRTSFLGCSTVTFAVDEKRAFETAWYKPVPVRYTARVATT